MTDSWPVCPCVWRPSGIRDQFFFLLEISFRQLRLCYFVVPSMMRGWVCNLPYNCFWALPEQSHLGQSPAELTAIFYCLIWDYPNLEDQVPVFISPRNRLAHPLALGCLLSPLTACRDCGGGILTCLHTVISSLQSHVTTDSQSVSMSWCQVHSGTCDQIIFSVWKLLCFLCGAPSLTRSQVCLLPVTVISV
jgi:hypothetical protein